MGLNMRYPKKRQANKDVDFSKITPERLKRCCYCGKAPEVKDGGVWGFVGCTNPECKFNPRTYYKPDQEQEVFQEWNLRKGDVNAKT